MWRSHVLCCLGRQAKKKKKNLPEVLGKLPIRNSKMNDIDSYGCLLPCLSAFLQPDLMFYKIFCIFMGLGKEWNTMATVTKHPCTGGNIQRTVQ